MDVDDDGKLKRRYINKRVNAAKEGINFSLSLGDFVSLLVHAGIKSSQCGIKGYHLARYGDSGGYEIGNCRFITHLDNMRERKNSEKNRSASRINAEAGRMAMKSIGRGELSRRIREGQANGSKRRGTGPYVRRRMEDGGALERKFMEVVESGIVVGSWGWKTKASRVLGVTPQHVGRMYERYASRRSGRPADPDKIGALGS